MLTHPTSRVRAVVITAALFVVPATTGLAQNAIQQAAPPANAAKVATRPILAVAHDAKARLRLALADPDTAAAILRGIDWLLAHQDENGRWDCDGFMKHDGADSTDGAGNPTNDIGVTGLALLAIAREGTPDAKDRRRDALLKGGHWLATQQQEKDGLIGTNASQTHAYDHAIATLGLCAVVAATQSAEARDTAKKAIEHIEKRRNPYGVWRYQPREVDGDTSITTWSVMACIAGREIGLGTDDNALRNTAVFLDAVTDVNGRTGYQKAGDRSSRDVRALKQFPADQTEALTAAAMWCRDGLGQAKTPVFESAAEILVNMPPQWSPTEGTIDFCYWFWGAEAMRRCVPARRDKWSTPLAEALRKGQRTDGAAAGSWDLVDPWSHQGGRIYTTAMAVLALQCLYELPAAAKPAAPPATEAKPDRK